MGFWRELFAREPVAMQSEQSAAQFSVELPQELLSLIHGGEAIARPVTRETALQVPAMLRARNIICGTAGTLPIKAIGPSRREERWPLFEQLDRDIPNSVVIAYTFEDMLFESIAWWRVLERDSRGFPMKVRRLPPGSVNVGGSAALPSEQRITPDTLIPQNGQIFIDGIPVPDSEVIRFDSPNPPLLVHAARAIRTALKLNQTADMYADEPMPQGYFEPKEGAEKPSDDEIPKMLDDWTAARKQRVWAYMSGMTPQTLSWNPEQLQLVDQRQHAVLEIARAAGIDPEDLGVSTTSRTYQNSEHRRQDLIDFTLGHYVSAFQDRLSMNDVSPRGWSAKVNFDAFLRSTTPTRMDAYNSGLRVGAYTVEEIRELEDRPPLTSSQRAEVADRRRRPVSSPNSNGENMSVNVPDYIDFEADESVSVSFDSVEASAEFRVNQEKRTISGLAVPWGKIARSGFSKWRFAEGSLRWSDEARVKLNLHHDREQMIGRAVRLQSTSRGLDVTFKVADVPEGTRALQLAKDGVMDGFSIEADFESENGDEWQPDPSDESIRLVRQARLTGIALTGVPAFDDARVAGVAATKNNNKGDLSMGNDQVAAQTDKPAAEFDLNGYLTKLGETVTASHAKLTEELGKSIGDSVSAGFKAALENMADPHGDGPEKVSASRFVVTREAPVYTLTGGANSLVRDAWHAQMSKDDDAKARIWKFRQQTEEMSNIVQSHLQLSGNDSTRFTTSSTGNSSEIIPPGYRPDLFVPQLAQGRPFVNALSRGVISNATPFVVPVFGSTTNATSQHTEGTNPSDGTLTFTTKTVSPIAVSGLLKLTREIVDSSNPAIDLIALAAMRESYARQTEQQVYNLLNGTDGQGGAIDGNGFVPSGAQVSETAEVTEGDGGLHLLRGVRSALALYPFRRFAAPNRALMSQEATTAFATAEDGNQRPLLPSVGAQNTAGLGNAVEVGWFVDGLPFVPAWSITGNTTTDADVFMLNSMDAWAWESPTLMFRFEERSGPAVIDLALFGYFATHLLRPVGLSAIRHTELP